MPESVQKDACQRTRSLSSHREELLTKIRAGRVRPLANFQGKLTPRHAVAGGSAGCRLKKSCEGVLLDVPRASPCSYLSSKACLAPLPRRRKSSNILGRQQGLNAPQGIQRILLPGSLPPGSGQGASKKAQLEHGARARLEAQLAHGRELRMETARASVVGRGRSGAQRECRGGAPSTLRRTGLGGATRRRRRGARARRGAPRSGMGGGEGERAAAWGRGVHAGRVVVAWQVLTTSPHGKTNPPFSPQVDSPKMRDLLS